MIAHDWRPCMGVAFSDTFRAMRAGRLVDKEGRVNLLESSANYHLHFSDSQIQHSVEIFDGIPDEREQLKRQNA